MVKNDLEGFTLRFAKPWDRNSSDDRRCDCCKLKLPLYKLQEFKKRTYCIFCIRSVKLAHRVIDSLGD